MLIWLVVIFFVLMAIGLPIAFALGGVSVLWTFINSGELTLGE